MISRIFCILAILVISYLAYRKLMLLNVQVNGETAEMTITEMPRSCQFYRRKYFMKVTYENHEYVKRIPAGYCDHHSVDEKVKLKYIKGKDSVMFPDEIKTSEFIVFGVLFALFGAGALWPAKKLKTKRI